MHNRKRLAAGFALVALGPLALSLTGCKQPAPLPNTVTMLIESSPANLDPRIGTDGQSEHIDALIFDALVRRDEHFNVQPWLAERWETPNPQTYIFHLHSGVHFHDGRLLTARDVKWTLDTILHGPIITAKAGAFQNIESVEAPDATTVIVRLKKPDAALLWNLSDGAIGIVPEGSGREFGQHPVGSGPYRFVRMEQDKEVVLERSSTSWQPQPNIEHIRFAVVPDAITRALEMEKGSADVCINALTADMTNALMKRPDLVVETKPGTVLNYISFNVSDPALRDVRVRQAIAYAINRPLIIHSLWRDRARSAESLLPPDHWAWSPNLPHYDYDPQHANSILDEAGLKRGPDGVRFHLTLKTSTDETSRLLAMILQQELRQIGIELEVRSFEFASFYADITRGAFQVYTLRWQGGNEDPDIFRYAYHTASLPPHGANRGRYLNPALDQLLNDAAKVSDQNQRRRDYEQAQQILARDLPSINLWYLDTVMIHNRRLEDLQPSSSGNFDFLRTAKLRP
ncbi:MAG TPA: ABC transporter substrate-binding protein [Acidisarcina sp.]|nr:ABC transporter substrate-binding protein [Acidisarcina sp.]